jgi:hypothetical protein
MNPSRETTAPMTVLPMGPVLSFGVVPDARR